MRCLRGNKYRPLNLLIKMVGSRGERKACPE